MAKKPAVTVPVTSKSTLMTRVTPHLFIVSLLNGRRCAERHVCASATAAARIGRGWHGSVLITKYNLAATSPGKNRYGEK